MKSVWRKTRSYPGWGPRLACSLKRSSLQGKQPSCCEHTWRGRPMTTHTHRGVTGERKIVSCTRRVESMGLEQPSTQNNKASRLQDGVCERCDTKC